jgi:hypothetical protein
MVGSKDHTKISTTNIIKLAMEALSADDQRPFEDLVMRDEKKVMRQWNKQRDKEEAELLHKLRTAQGGGGKVLVTLHGGSPPEDHPSRGDRYGISPASTSGSRCKYSKSISYDFHGSTRRSVKAIYR